MITATVLRLLRWRWMPYGHARQAGDAGEETQKLRDALPEHVAFNCLICAMTLQRHYVKTLDILPGCFDFDALIIHSPVPAESALLFSGKHHPAAICLFADENRCGEQFSRGTTSEAGCRPNVPGRTITALRRSSTGVTV